MSFPLTAIQMQCLPIVRGLVADKPWLPVSYVFAHVRIESGWNPSIKASDYTATGSIGLMQVTAATALQFGGGDQTLPENSLRAGVEFLAWGREFLMQKWGFHDSILYHPVCEGFNEGFENVIRGRQDQHYWLKWSAAQQGYGFLDMEQFA